MTTDATTGLQLKKARQAARLSAQQVADRADLSRTRVVTLENSRSVTAEAASRLALAIAELVLER